VDCESKRIVAQDGILSRATRGDPETVLADMARLLDPKAEAYDPSLLPFAPGLLHGICLRAAAMQIAKAKTVHAGLSSIETLLPATMSYALDPARTLEYEIAGAEALAAGDLARVIRRFDRSRAYPKAIEQVLKEFRGAPFTNIIAAGQAINWDPVPRRSTGDEQGEYTYPDFKSKRYIVRTGGGESMQAVVRTTDRAGEGYRVNLDFEAEEPAGAWAIAFGGSKESHVQLEYGRGTLAVRRTNESDPSKDVVLQSRALKQASFAVSFVPVGELVLVLLDDRVAFTIDEKLSNTIKIGVVRGRLAIAAVETHDVFEEND
jgi:hypothetical protein